jgi:hypothetical protein
MPKNQDILFVSLRDAKPNKLFTEEHRQSIPILFLVYNKTIPCAECGKKKKVMWTMLCQFKSPSRGASVVKESGKSHLPLTPVCQEHLLAPDFSKEAGD